ncbi:MAG: hypothetical protein U0168_05525 [Nannocystaceae bacterium]
MQWPEGGQIRVDAAVASGSEVSSHYDPAIAKLATRGRDREEAIARMRRALRETVVLGVETNLALHLRILDDPDFARGTSVTTRYIAEHPHVTEPTGARCGRQRPDRGCGRSGGRCARGASAASTPSASEGDAAWRHAARWRR